MKLRITLKTIVLLFSFGKILSQNESLNSTKYQFSKEVFEKKYSKQNFERFKGKITIVDDNFIQFDEKTSILNNVEKNLQTHIYKWNFLSQHYNRQSHFDS